MKKLLYILMFLITFLSNILLTLYIWINNIFGAVNFENIMFTIATPMQGSASDQEIISSFVLNVIILSFILTILLFIPFILYHYRFKIHTFLHNIYNYLCQIKKHIFTFLHNIYNYLCQIKRHILIFLHNIYNYLCQIKKHILLHYISYTILCVAIILLCIFFNLTIQKKFKPSQFYTTSLKEKMIYIRYCNTIESIQKSIDQGATYIYYNTQKNELYDYDKNKATQCTIKKDIAEQLKSILSTHPNLILFLPASNQVPQNLEFLLQVLPFPKQIAIECSNLWWYKEAKRCGILYPILSLNNLPNNHFKQIFHKNISLLSCSDKMFSNSEYLSIIQELHYRGATIFLHGSVDKNQHNYGILFDAIFI